MKQLTLTQRLKIYKKVEKDLKDDFPFICPCLCSHYCDIKDYTLYKGSEIKIIFPEFWTQKPKDSFENKAWWAPFEIESRLKAIRKAILLTEIEIDFEKLLENEK